MLFDRFNRIHDYLRISLTDHCNFRCFYCMPDECTNLTPSAQLMTSDEIVAIATEFVKLGVRKIRLTGGEPLVRKDFPTIINRLSELRVELLLTTNGSLLHHHIDNLKSAGVNTVNVSLDTLNPEMFFGITRRDKFELVWSNILALLDNGIRVKINVVAVRGMIEAELFDFINITKHLPLHVRFIEYMPFTGNKWNSAKVITASEMLELVSQEYDVVKLKDEPHATAQKYKVIGHEGSLAFITTMSKHFCGECNRVRLTAEGKIKNCLFGREEIDLLSAFRKGEQIAPFIQQSISRKKAIMGGQFEDGYINTDAALLVNRSMVQIGG